VYLFYPYRTRFEFDPDEGGEAMRALLVARGYPLYSQVYSDQPPVLTYLLAACMRIFGPDVNIGRTLILLLSTVLVAAAVQFLYSNWGVWHAVAGTLLLFLLPFYNTLSVSLMRGLPAISFAMLSLLALSTWHQRRQTRWLLLSGIALAVSIHIKLFTAFLAPIFILGLLWDQWARAGRSLSNWQAMIRPALLWCLVFGGVFIALLSVGVGFDHIDKLITPHLTARQLSSYIARAAAHPIHTHLQDAWPFLFLAFLGLVFTIIERRLICLYLFAWSLVAFLMLSFHAPVWYHHQLLVSIPAALMAAIAVGEAIRLLPRMLHERLLLGGRSVLVALALAGFLLAMLVRLPVTLAELQRTPALALHPPHKPWTEQLILTRMANHAPQTRWVLTDLPMYAFRVGLLVPPHLSYVSEKSLLTGELTEEGMIRTIEGYRPEMVLLGRGEYPELEGYLKADYQLLFTREFSDLFIRDDLKGGS